VVTRRFISRPQSSPQVQGRAVSAREIIKLWVEFELGVRKAEANTLLI
jgi:hypothetical protein